MWGRLERHVLGISSITRICSISHATNHMQHIICIGTKVFFVKILYDIKLFERLHNTVSITGI